MYRKSNLNENNVESNSVVEKKTTFARTVKAVIGNI